jgi:electron transport complex protein RnfB
MWLTVLIAVATITALALVSGLLLGFASQRLPASKDSLVDQIDALLPQTQCAQCGFIGCKPYASAIADNEAAINLCPPGGDETVRRIAQLLGRDEVPPLAAASTAGALAIIDESSCIGCTHCRSACPVDAIVGAHQLMHSVIASECTGCELCIAPCPVNCISMVPAA